GRPALGSAASQRRLQIVVPTLVPKPARRGTHKTSCHAIESNHAFNHPPCGNAAQKSNEAAGNASPQRPHTLQTAAQRWSKNAHTKPPPAPDHSRPIAGFGAF